MNEKRLSRRVTPEQVAEETKGVDTGQPEDAVTHRRPLSSSRRWGAPNIGQERNKRWRNLLLSRSRRPRIHRGNTRPKRSIGVGLYFKNKTNEFLWVAYAYYAPGARVAWIGPRKVGGRLRRE